MMRLAIPALLGFVLLATGFSADTDTSRPEVVQFQANGVLVGNTAITSATIELANAGKAYLLASKTCVEPLGMEIEVVLAAERSLIIEPGVRIQKTKDGFELLTHGRKFIELETADGVTRLTAPAVIKVTAKGLEAAGKEISLKGTTRVRLAYETGAAEVHTKDTTVRKFYRPVWGPWFDIHGRLLHPNQTREGTHQLPENSQSGS